MEEIPFTFVASSGVRVLLKMCNPDVASLLVCSDHLADAVRETFFEMEKQVS